jgi:hypothetical protein
VTPRITIPAGYDIAGLASHANALAALQVGPLGGGFLAALDAAIDRAWQQASAHPTTPGLPCLLTVVTDLAEEAHHALQQQNRAGLSHALLRLIGAGYALWCAGVPVPHLPPRPPHAEHQHLPAQLPANVTLLARPLRPAWGATPPEAA